MTESSASVPDAAARRTRNRRLVFVLIAVVAVAALAAVIWFLLGGNGAATVQSPTQTPAPSASSPASAPPEATEDPQPTATVDPYFGEPVGDRAPQGETAELGDGLTAELVALTGITAEGTQVGEVGGPAVQVDLEIVNGSDAPLSLDLVTVNAYYGQERNPASPYFEPADAKFSGTLAPGETAQGRYVFRVPEGERGIVFITLSTGPDSSLVVLG